MQKYKYLYLLPILIIIAFSIYFSNMTRVIQSALSTERIARTSAVFQMLDSVSRGEVSLIIITAVLNIAMVFVICKFTGSRGH